jgi:uncharacterized protein
VTDGHQSTTDVDLPSPVCDEPVRRAVMVQRWADLVYVHWRFDPAVVQALLPAGVVVDRFDSSAWVGLIPFRMEGLGLPRLAPLPHVGTFPEVNVRTYVRAGQRRAVWFFSLDVDRYLPAVTARAAYSLPYCVGDTWHRRTGATIEARVRRRWPRPGAQGAATELRAELFDDVIADDPLHRFLTARWGLVSAGRRGGLRYAPVDHEPWSLRHARLDALDDTLVVAAGLPAPHGEPHVMWSPGVDVRIGRPVRLAT